MQRIMRLWPLAAAAFFATTFNFWAIAWLLKSMDVSGSAYWLLQTACSQLEILFWWWFFRRGPQALHDAVNLAERLIEDFETEGFPLELRGLAEHVKRLARHFGNWFKHRILRHNGEGATGHVHRLATVVRKSLAPIGYLIIYALGSWPTGNIVVGVPLCRIVHLPGALIVLMLGNVNTVIANGAMLEVILWLWRNHRLLLVIGVTASAALAYLWRRWRRR